MDGYAFFTPMARDPLGKPILKAGKMPNAVITLQKRRLFIELIASVPVTRPRVVRLRAQYG